MNCPEAICSSLNNNCMAVRSNDFAMLLKPINIKQTIVPLFFYVDLCYHNVLKTKKVKTKNALNMLIFVSI